MRQHRNYCNRLWDKTLTTDNDITALPVPIWSCSSRRSSASTTGWRRNPRTPGPGPGRRTPTPPGPRPSSTRGAGNTGRNSRANIRWTSCTAWTRGTDTACIWRSGWTRTGLQTTTTTQRSTTTPGWGEEEEEEEEERGDGWGRSRSAGRVCTRAAHRRRSRLLLKRWRQRTGVVMRELTGRCGRDRPRSDEQQRGGGGGGGTRQKTLSGRPASHRSTACTNTLILSRTLQQYCGAVYTTTAQTYCYERCAREPVNDAAAAYSVPTVRRRYQRSRFRTIRLSPRYRVCNCVDNYWNDKTSFDG